MSTNRLNTFNICAIVSVLTTSLFGACCNLYLFVKFATQKNSNAFQTFCMLKSLCNTIICSAFLFWVVPITWLSLSISDVNYLFNRIVGMVAGTAAFFFNSLLNICTSGNRFFALQFPLGLKGTQRLPITALSITVSCILVSVFSIFTLPEGCGFLYDPDLSVWRPEFSACSDKFAIIVPYIVFATTITTNGFNCATLMCLMMSKVGGLKKKEVEKRRKKWRVMFTQSFIQDCLQLAQIICSYFLCKLSEAIWYRFLCMTMSFLLATTLDGLVMFICQKEFHPKFLRNKASVSRWNAIPKLSVVYKISVRGMQQRKQSHVVSF